MGGVSRFWGLNEGQFLGGQLRAFINGTAIEAQKIIGLRPRLLLTRH